MGNSRGLQKTIAVYLTLRMTFMQNDLTPNELNFTFIPENKCFNVTMK